ncbi:hypothetical protein HPB47_021787 [Ixodes persulcatus]|uniref:Uncharacterized protein n=1 Tax=Ixodes persulcatus TaxID=34615 RepID=A0AC60QBQ5_IXOPE|nr:hypothetical protein HPB47_021787 [Ixodes persulcatus]
MPVVPFPSLGLQMCEPDFIESDVYDAVETLVKEKSKDHPSRKVDITPPFFTLPRQEELQNFLRPLGDATDRLQSYGVTSGMIHLCLSTCHAQINPYPAEDVPPQIPQGTEEPAPSTLSERTTLDSLWDAGDLYEILDLVSPPSGVVQASELDSYLRQYSYAIRHGCFPCEVVALFNGAQPSTGHAKRICRILRSESWKQVGRYRDVLRIKCHALSVNESSAERNYKLHLRTAAQYTEVFWQQTRMTLAKKARRNEGGQQEVTVLEDVILPKQIKDCLDKGPKYSQEPCMNPVLKLSLIRWMGDKAKPEDRERCVADGVDVLQRLEGKTTRKFKTNTIVDYFLEHNLKLLTSDKEGGFVVLPEALYKTKAKEAIQKNFKPPLLMYTVIQ